MTALFKEKAYYVSWVIRRFEFYGNSSSLFLMLCHWIFFNSRLERRYSERENGICRKYLKIIGSLEKVGNAHTKAYWFNKVRFLFLLLIYVLINILSVKRCINVDIQIESVFSADLQDNICFSVDSSFGIFLALILVLMLTSGMALVLVMNYGLILFSISVLVPRLLFFINPWAEVSFGVESWFPYWSKFYYLSLVEPLLSPYLVLTPALVVILYVRLYPEQILAFVIISALVQTPLALSFYFTSGLLIRHHFLLLTRINVLPKLTLHSIFFYPI